MYIGAWLKMGREDGEQKYFEKYMSDDSEFPFYQIWGPIPKWVLMLLPELG